MQRPCLLFLLISGLTLCRCGASDIARIADYPKIVGIIPDRTFGPEIGSAINLKNPIDLAVNSAGEMFVADYGNDRLVKLDSDGRFLAESGGRGTGNSDMNGPISVAVDNASNVYVIDSGNSRIMIFDRLLNPIMVQYGFRREQLVLFQYPVCVRLSRGGYIYIGDTGLRGIYKLDPFFEYVASFGEIGHSIEIGAPTGIAIAADSRIFVADKLRRAIAIFDDFGMAIGSFDIKLPSAPTSMAISPNGIIWVATQEAIAGLDRHGNILITWGGSEIGANGHISAVVSSGDTLLYLVDSRQSRIMLLRPLYGG